MDPLHLVALSTCSSSSRGHLVDFPIHGLQTKEFCVDIVNLCLSLKSRCDWSDPYIKRSKSDAERRIPMSFLSLVCPKDFADAQCTYLLMCMI